MTIDWNKELFQGKHEAPCDINASYLYQVFKKHFISFHQMLCIAGFYDIY